MSEKNGAELIQAERERQMTEEGFTAQHDHQHADQLERAAWCYLYRGDRQRPVELWPWSERYWKPKDELSNLVRAGALYLAARDAEPYRPRANNYAACAKTIAEKIDALLAAQHAETTR